jgi:hypothetical protein
MSDKVTLFELKEKAKWSHDFEEKESAIRELSTHGLNAVPSLEEILNITAYDDIKKACTEAIRVILANSKGDDRIASGSDSNPVLTADNKPTRSQKKEEKQEQEGVAATETRLADLPP